MAELNARLIAKASGVAGEAPQPSDLEVAELAVNTADGKFFTKHTDGTIKEISGSGGGEDVVVVTSVNRQTGDVSLSVQDMDDFTPPDSLFTWSTCIGDNTIGLDDVAGEWGGFYALGNTYVSVKNFDDTSDRTAALELIQIDDVISVNGTEATVVGLANFIGVQGELRITFSGNLGLDFTAGNNVLTIESPIFSAGYTPLADGDYIQWNAADQKFKPAQISDPSLEIGDLQDVEGPVSRTASWQVVTANSTNSGMDPGEAYIYGQVSLSPVSLEGDQKSSLRAWAQTLILPTDIVVSLDGDDYVFNCTSISDDMDLTGFRDPSFNLDGTGIQADAHMGKTLTIAAYDEYVSNEYSDGDGLVWDEANSVWTPQRVSVLSEKVLTEVSYAAFDMPTAGYAWANGFGQLELSSFDGRGNDLDALYQYLSELDQRHAAKVYINDRLVDDVVEVEFTNYTDYLFQIFVTLYDQGVALLPRLEVTSNRETGSESSLAFFSF